MTGGRIPGKGRKCANRGGRAKTGKRLARFLLATALLAFCFSARAITKAEAAEAGTTAHGQAGGLPVRLRVCHGYGCYFRTLITMTAADMAAVSVLFTDMGKTPEGERAAIKKAVAIFEERATQIIGVRDEPKMIFGRPMRKGQMDCVDEAANTETFLRSLKTAGYLTHHDVLRRAARGILIDGRYPHWTAVIVDGGGVKWAVDSWYEPGGGEPDIMPLKQWKKRGLGGKR